MNAALEGRRKPFAQRALTSSKDRTAKNGRKSGRKRVDRTITVDRRSKSIIGDESCPDAEYHFNGVSGFEDVNGHAITKERYELLIGAQL